MLLVGNNRVQKGQKGCVDQNIPELFTAGRQVDQSSNCLR